MVHLPLESLLPKHYGICLVRDHWALHGPRAHPVPPIWHGATFKVFICLKFIIKRPVLNSGLQDNSVSRTDAQVMTACLASPLISSTMFCLPGQDLNIFSWKFQS